jgi:hypothetical protein
MSETKHSGLLSKPLTFDLLESLKLLLRSEGIAIIKTRSTEKYEENK